jgi:hypothetical protein
MTRRARPSQDPELYIFGHWHAGFGCLLRMAPIISRGRRPALGCERMRKSLYKMCISPVHTGRDFCPKQRCYSRFFSSLSLNVSFPPASKHGTA